MADSGLIWSLPQRVGPARARDIMLTGRVVQAEEAGVTGLANTIVPAGQALDAAVKVAGAFTQMAPLALASMKAVQIGRASCRERVCQYVEISGVAGSLKKKKRN